MPRRPSGSVKHVSPIARSPVTRSLNSAARVEIRRFARGWTLRFVQCKSTSFIKPDECEPGSNMRIEPPETTFHALYAESNEFPHKEYINRKDDKPRYKQVSSPLRARFLREGVHMRHDEGLRQISTRPSRGTNLAAVDAMLLDTPDQTKLVQRLHTSMQSCQSHISIPPQKNHSRIIPRYSPDGTRHATDPSKQDTIWRDGKPL